METSQVNVSDADQHGRSPDSPLQNDLQDRVTELRADVTERPFLYLVIAFIAGVVSHTFPARMLFLVIVRLISWLIGPAILLMGLVKLSELFSGSNTLQRYAQEFMGSASNKVTNSAP
jgi:hypothetical protein